MQLQPQIDCCLAASGHRKFNQECWTQRRRPMVALLTLLMVGTMVHLVIHLIFYQRALNTWPRVASPAGNWTANISCENHLAASDCMAGASWTYNPPVRLGVACRSARITAANSVTNSRPLVLVFVPISANLVKQRATIRRTWGSRLDILIFLVQLRIDEIMNSELITEAKVFDDIFVLRSSTADSYQCLTLKILSFLRWYSQNCPGGFHYLLKSDHDSYWNAMLLQNLLRQRLNATATAVKTATNGKLNPTKASAQLPAEILGAIQYNAAVQRSRDSKFCTPLEAYPAEKYPTYASGGPGYVLSDAAVMSLMEAADRLTPFWLEDVYITGMLAASSKSPVQLVHLSNVFLRAPDSLSPTHLGIHGAVSIDQLKSLHARISR